jgi:hypothetical protein
VSDSLIVNTLEETKEANVFPMLLVMVLIDDRGNSADRLTVPFGEKEFHRCMSVEGISLAVNQLLPVEQQRRNPRWVSVIYLPREADEGFLIALCLHRTD